MWGGVGVPVSAARPLLKPAGVATYLVRGIADGDSLGCRLSQAWFDRVRRDLFYFFNDMGWRLPASLVASGFPPPSSDNQKRLQMLPN